MKALRLFSCGIVAVALLVNASALRAVANTPPRVSFVQATATAKEAGLVPAELVVTRDSTVDALTVTYSVRARTVFDITNMFKPIDFVLRDRDFEPLPGTITFKPGQSQASIVVKPMTNYQYRSCRHDRNVPITLEPGEGYTIAGKASGVVTIIDDPSPKHPPTDAVFFSSLDLSRPELSAVKAAVSANDFGAARTALASYFRKLPARMVSARIGAFRERVVQNTLHDTYTVSGLTFTFPKGKIDWSAMNARDPFSGLLNPNVGWELNRFQWWPDLVEAYRKDPVANLAAGERLVYEAKDWFATSPLELEANGLTPGIRWRSLEVGGRLAGDWIRAFEVMRSTPLVSDDLIIDWLKSISMHARYLEVSSELHTNRGVGEARGLLSAGILFPQFRDAVDWRELGTKRLESIISTDVLPDGAFSELSPGYQDITIPAYEETLELAAANGIKLSENFRNAVMRMFDFMLYMCEPNRLIPPLNDSQTLYKPLNVRLGIAARLFPERQDFQWLVSDGKTGSPPADTSHLLPNAGNAIMRSGWGWKDNYLLLDAGPLGMGGHAHEDKLSINVDGYGVRHIIDCGPYDYVDTNPFRKYCRTTLGKSAPIIDGLSQNRYAVEALHERPCAVTWLTSDLYDYAAGFYGVDPDETWGPQKERPAETTRHIFFLKPDVWVVIDAFKALDKKEHSYAGYFQCNDDSVDVDQKTRSVTIQLKAGEFDPFYRVITKTNQPSLTITPLLRAEESLSVVKGQTEPEISGWRFEKSTTWKKQPIPTAKYMMKTSGDTQLAYVLAAAPADAEPRHPAVKPVQTDPETWGVEVSLQEPVRNYILLIALDGKTIHWQGKTYGSPALIIDDGKIAEWSHATVR